MGSDRWRTRTNNLLNKIIITKVTVESIKEEWGRRARAGSILRFTHITIVSNTLKWQDRLAFGVAFLTLHHRFLTFELYSILNQLIHMLHYKVIWWCISFDLSTISVFSTENFEFDTQPTNTHGISIPARNSRALLSLPNKWFTWRIQ